MLDSKNEGSDVVKGDDQHDKRSDADAEDLRKANENVRKAQGDDSPGQPIDGREGNRPRFDRDR